MRRRARQAGRSRGGALPAVLTIAGSDSGGGAGIQADLKTFMALGVYGASAITCVTAQNPDGVAGIAALAPRLVALQIRQVCWGFPIAAAKTGMLYSAAIIRAVARTVEELKIPNLVVDPVMVATSGARLLQPEAVRALRAALLPLARLITPNLPEAEALLDRRIATREEAAAAAAELSREFGTACVVKGGHLAGREVWDVLADGRRLWVFKTPRVAARETHGTGCTFSAAAAALLARGRTLADAVQGAQRVVGAALRRAARVGRHYPLRVGG